MTTTLTASPATAPAVPIALADFRSLLTDLRADCVRGRQVAVAETARSLPDPVAVTRAGHLLRTIGEIDAALLRIDDGSYGSCVHCGSPIPTERLVVRPFAAGCVTCQEGAR